MKTGIPLCVLVAVLGAVCLGPRLSSEGGAPVSAAETYCDAVAYQNEFLAVGGQGRLDRISVDGSVESLAAEKKVQFHDIAECDGQAVAVGDCGKIAVVSGEYETAVYSSQKNSDLYCVCGFRGVWLIGGENGTLQKSGDLRSWQPVQLSIKGTVTGLAATDERCIGVTDRGEIFVTTDGSHWTLLDYNGYYGQSVSFQGIEALDGMFWAYGTDADGRSEIVMSLEGGVWSERTLMVMEQSQEIDLSGAEITGLCSDGEQVIAALADGRALTMPDCSVCNKLSTVSDWKLGAVAYNEGKLLFVGDQFQYSLTDVNAIRQERIKAEAAREKMEAGALMVDVRTQEEYDKGHIAGSIRIEEDQISEQLPAVCPDRTREIIFYCVSGKRSQQALETARSLGYKYVYNLGGIADWPYGVE